MKGEIDMKKQMTFTNKELIFKDPSRKFHDERVPCLLFITMEPVQGGYKVSIQGRENPLPFKEATIHRNGTTIEKWLEENGWTMIGINYIK